MKLFLIKISLFFVAITVVDVFFGIACQYMNVNSKGGGIKSRYYVCKESNEDVLIFGSSRAKHHYVPEVLEDSLGMTCYNTGEDGNGIILSYGYLKMITERYSPKLIIYDVSGFDIYIDDNMKYLDLLKPYYDESGIDSIFCSVNPKSRYMMLSNLYRYNTTCLRIIGNYIHPSANYPKGYVPLLRVMDYEPDIRIITAKAIDTLKISYFEQFIRLAIKNKITLICFVSPSYNTLFDDSYYAPIEQLCIQYNVPFYYYADDPDISYNNRLFQDGSHLNDLGARLFTSKVGSTCIKLKEDLSL